MRYDKHVIAFAVRLVLVVAGTVAYLWLAVLGLGSVTPFLTNPALTALVAVFFV
jgi:hypothetical protein